MSAPHSEGERWAVSGGGDVDSVYSLLFIVGIVGNGLVFWVVLKAIKTRSMTDVCLLNLAAADLLLLGCLPFLAQHSRDQWVFGTAMCKIVLGIYHMGFYSGIFFILLMSIDRYLAIVHAVYALKGRTWTYGAMASGVIWIISFCALFPEVLFISVKENDSKWQCKLDYSGDNTWLKIFRLVKLNVLGMLVPLVMIGFCYSMILKRLLSCRFNQRQTIRLVVLVVVAFFCCWMPFNIMSFVQLLEQLQVFVSCSFSKAIFLGLQITEALAYSHSCLNPIIYVFVGRKFRKHLLKIMGKVPCMGCQFVKRQLTTSMGQSYSQNSTVEERSTGM
ncbi:hypothetical protein JZ751_009604 [Albula glossodonta]|uniref:G-protein coupled receptors family 1 profile domain-containing protein n=1 Tax=Albula glossodonta TaxID=121402 RepID=A0A8T2NVS7_9TELE|nr:hypothetical protein JZ751_009604 [Albula glossodonta]